MHYSHFILYIIDKILKGSKNGGNTTIKSPKLYDAKIFQYSLYA